MTNYEIMKRPKTNRIAAAAIQRKLNSVTGSLQETFDVMESGLTNESTNAERLGYNQTAKTSVQGHQNLALSSTGQEPPKT